MKERTRVETRAVWLRPMEEVQTLGTGMSKQRLREIIKCIASSGFNVIVLNCLSEGYCLFPSESLVQGRIFKQHPRFRRWDALSIILEEALARGINVYAGLDALVLGSLESPGVRYFSRKHGICLMRNREGDFSPVGDDEKNLYFCPSNPEFRHFLGDFLSELAERYPVAGAVLCFRRFPEETGSTGASFCFCKSCKQLIRKDINIDLEILEIAETSPAYKKWQEWRCKEFSEFLKYLRTRFVTSRQGAPLIAFIPRGSISGVNSSIYAKPLWEALEGSLLSSAIVSDYDIEKEAFAMQLAEDSSNYGKRMLFMPFLPEIEVEKLEKFAQICRRHPVSGFLYKSSKEFHLSEGGSAEKCLPIFIEPAFAPEINAELAVLHLCGEVIEELKGETSIASFLKDMEKLLSGKERISLRGIDSLVKNLSSIEEKVISGEISVPSGRERITRNLLLIQRLLWLFQYTER